ncbi:sodium-dependent transporter [Solimonas sp. SE-A11]|uniref:sodium-dependent transporter n=1 Tax=Solimonas sp. SE-A11 TaxID=3054954 RepID=UPI00259C97B4|nr:sodium-dependent transporter [Solimonas sp. SE-A11]MDM4771655.1 sodium-dependent transporter [Solimonas sp. SE-A11]
MNIRESSYGYWGSSSRFLWVAAGATVGIGNVARLPYLMGEHGGAVFLGFYLLCLLLVGLPLLATEWVLGRWMRDDVISGFRRVVDAAGASRFWVVIGYLSLASAVMVLSYYSVIAGWSLAYAVRAAGGVFDGIGVEHAREAFLSFAQDPERALSWHTIFMVTACIIVTHGFRDGIERAALRLLPTAFLVAIGLCLYTMLTGSTAEALRFLLTPDWQKFGWRGALEALQQAFFTMALGIGSMLALGSYLPARAPLKRLALGVVLIDTGFSLLAGLAIFALIFSAGVEPASGVALLFQALPAAFPAGVVGIVVALSLYTMLFIVTLTAASALLETTTRYLMDRFRTTRVFAATSSSLLIWFLGLGTLLSFGVLQDVTLMGRNFFGWMQWLTANWFAPATALLICIFTARIMPEEMARSAFGEREGWLFSLWRALLRYPTRLALIIILGYSAGLLDWIAELWG